MTSQRTRERLIERLKQAGIQDQAVLEAIREVPRHIFVDEALASRAYEDTALPIGFNQTISQPYIVARMTEILRRGLTLQRVLEVGTGSGYQAAILARLVPEVYTVERIEALLKRARGRMFELGMKNVRIKHADGKVGWPEYAPYDGIIATAAPLEVPVALLDQLKLGGRLIIPVGRQGGQQLLLFTRTDDGFTEEVLEAVSFVPMLAGDS
jgi:protein-L-isoaspartate(D-aspartate) O-methyltransferase